MHLHRLNLRALVFEPGRGGKDCVFPVWVARKCLPVETGRRRRKSPKDKRENGRRALRSFCPSLVWRFRSGWAFAVFCLFLSLSVFFNPASLSLLVFFFFFRRRSERPPHVGRFFRNKSQRAERESRVFTPAASFLSRYISMSCLFNCLCLLLFLLSSFSGCVLVLSELAARVFSFLSLSRRLSVTFFEMMCPRLQRLFAERGKKKCKGSRGFFLFQISLVDLVNLLFFPHLESAWKQQSSRSSREEEREGGQTTNEKERKKERARDRGRANSHVSKEAWCIAFLGLQEEEREEGVWLAFSRSCLRTILFPGCLVLTSSRLDLSPSLGFSPTRCCALSVLLHPSDLRRHFRTRCCTYT